jgi:hypothetical protein
MSPTSSVILWVVTLVVAMLWTAAVAAFAGRARRPERWRLGLFAAVGVPLLVLGGLIAIACILRAKNLMQTRWMVGGLALVAVYEAGAVFLTLRAVRARQAGPPESFTWPRVPLAAALVAAAALWSALVWSLDRGSRRQAEALRSEAVVIRREAAPPAVDDAQNAALVYQRAFQRIQADTSWQGDDNQGHPFRQSHPDYSHADAPLFLANHEETIALLLQAAALPACRFAHDAGQAGGAVVPQEQDRFTSAARLLEMHAHYEWSHGSVETALRDVHAMIRLAQHAGNRPSIDAARAAFAIDGLAIDTLRNVLAGVMTVEQLALVPIEGPQAIERIAHRALRGEEASALATIGDVFAGHAPPPPEIGRSRFRFASPFRAFFLHGEARACRYAMDRYRELSSKPYAPARAEIEGLGTSPLAGGVLVQQRSPARSDFLRDAAVARARRETARVALAIARYRFKTNERPAKLEDLVPAFLDSVPPDPCDGRPLRLAVPSDAIVPYSVGPDGVDGGGAEYNREQHTGDLRFWMEIAQ